MWGLFALVCSALGSSLKCDCCPWLSQHPSISKFIIRSPSVHYPFIIRSLFVHCSLFPIHSPIAIAFLHVCSFVDALHRSGKTASYVWPMIAHVRDQSPLKIGMFLGNWSVSCSVIVDLGHPECHLCMFGWMGFELLPFETTKFRPICIFFQREMGESCICNYYCAVVVN